MQENICLPCSRVDLSVLRWTSSCCFHYHFGTKLSLRCGNLRALPRYKQFFQCNAGIEQSARWARTHGEARSVFTAKLALPVARNPTHCIFATNTPPSPLPHACRHLTSWSSWQDTLFILRDRNSPCDPHIYMRHAARTSFSSKHCPQTLLNIPHTYAEHAGNAKKVKRWYGTLVTHNWSQTHALALYAALTRAATHTCVLHCGDHVNMSAKVVVHKHSLDIS